MQLFLNQIKDIQAQIEALQAEAAKLQDLENATASSLANLKAVVANIEGDEAAIAALKSAINDLFPIEETYICGDCGNSFPNSEMVEGEDVCINCGESEEDEQPKFGTPDKPCPATTTGECFNPECESETFVCEGCGKETPYCYGGDGDELCNDCWTSPKDETDDLTKEKIQELKKIREEKAAPKFKKMFEGEPEPDEFDVVIYNDRVHRYENTLGIHFKLKREAKAWASQFETKYYDCKIEIHKDDFESFGYVLKMTKGNPDDSQWWQEVTSYDYSKSPEENRQREKYHVLIQNQGKSETVEIESSDEAVARKNYQHLVKSLPDSYVSLMSNKRGCVESHKPAVHQTLPEIEPLPGDVVDEDEDDEPAFSLMATGMGWLNVVCDGEVLGTIFSNQSGWELESGEQFATREEAAMALFNSTPSAA